jgi:hypothetical protein
VIVTGPSAAIARWLSPSPSATTTDAHGVRRRLRSRPPATVANQQRGSDDSKADRVEPERVRPPSSWRGRNSGAPPETSSTRRRPSPTPVATSHGERRRHDRSSPPEHEPAPRHRSRTRHHQR